MKINSWQQKYLHVYALRNLTAVIKLRQLSQIWLLNCFEGCQHALTRKNIKLAQITAVILTHNSPGCVNGLLGLLSTISLSTEGRKIHIYAPASTCQYLVLGRKYSRTSFRHKLYFYHSLGSNTMQHFDEFLNCVINAGAINYSHFSLLDAERSGVFNCSYAKTYSVPPGSLYGHLKQGQSFILPDGFIVCGQHFIYGYYLGCELTIMSRTTQRRYVSIVGSVSYAIYS